MPPKAAAGTAAKVPAAKASPSPASKTATSSASPAAKKSPATASKPASSASAGAKSSSPAKPGAGSKSVSKPASKGSAAAKSGAAGKESKSKEPSGPPPDIAEEAQYLESYEAPADPWAKFKSPYGGALTAAECFDKLSKETRVASTVSSEELKAAVQALDPPAASAAVGTARAVEAVLSKRGDLESSERLVLSRCGLSAFQMAPIMAKQFVELDLSSNALSNLNKMAPNCLRILDLSGNRLTQFPVFETPMPKLVSLRLAFNDLGGALPPRSTLETLGSLRSLSVQNCMLSSIASSSPDLPPPLDALTNLVHLDLGFNLLADPAELLLLTSLQRLASLDVGCNEMCGHAEYEEKKALLQRRIATLKTLNEQALVRSFGGYGENAVDNAGSSIKDAMSQDNSSCSCIEGNPCMSADNCLNWNSRFSIAHKVRMEKFWDQGKNFIDF